MNRLESAVNAIGGGLFLTLFIVLVIQLMAGFSFSLNKPLA